MKFTPLPADTFPFEVAYAVLCIKSENSNSAVEKGLSESGTGFDPESNTPELALLVGDPDKTFSLASVTKPIAAYAVLAGVERGDFPLEAPAGPQGATLAHLLSHASGLPSMPGEPIAQPGKRRIYSNYGFDVLSSWVQEHTGKPISAYIQQNVLNPLGMDTTLIPGSIAYSGRSTLDSLIRFAAELLQPTLVSSELFTKATEIAFNNIPGVLPGYGRQENNAWGMGFEIRAQKSPHWLAPDFSAHSFGHFGQSGSFIWVDPQVRKAGVFLSNRNFGQDHIMRWGDLTAQMRALN